MNLRSEGSLAANNIKALFFENIFSELENMGMGEDWLAFAGGGNIKISENYTIMIYCNNFNVRCEVKAAYKNALGEYWLTSSREEFDLNHPDCRKQILKWAQKEYDSKYRRTK
jgi:hypothetical protein